MRYWNETEEADRKPGKFLRNEDEDLYKTSIAGKNRICKSNQARVSNTDS